MLPLTTLASSNEITLEEMQKDITYLASDDLKGRASFTEGIEQAGNYIAKRFAEIGLRTAENAPQFKQQFNITNIVPTAVSLTLNGVEVPNEYLALASTLDEISWQEPKTVTSHIVGADDDMRGVLREINAQGGQHLVLINTKHAKLFARYQHFFQGGWRIAAMSSFGL